MSLRYKHQARQEVVDTHLKVLSGDSQAAFSFLGSTQLICQFSPGRIQARKAGLSSLQLCLLTSSVVQRQHILKQNNLNLASS